MLNNFRCICLAFPWGEPWPSTNFHSCHVTCDIQNNLGTNMTKKKKIKTWQKSLLYRCEEFLQKFKKLRSHPHDKRTMKYFIRHQNKQPRTQYIVNLLDGLFTDSHFLYCHQICAPIIATSAPQSKYPCRREQNQPPQWAHASLSLDLLLLPPIPPASVKNVE